MLNLYSVCLAVLFAAPGADAAADSLGGEPLVWDGDLSVRMMDGLHSFVERKITESIAHRPQLWQRSLGLGGRVVKARNRTFPPGR